MKFVRAFLLCVLAFASGANAADPQPDRWQPVRRLIGDWVGTAIGESGEGSVKRRYALVMNERYIHETNTTVYPPQEKNKAGEVHEHWSMISFDKSRKTLVMRQFHQESFVNTYRQADGPTDSGKLLFESESFENFSNSWKARETYEFRSDDEFIETFELAPPGKPFQVYSRNHFKRASKD
jgi:hypothetical protein